MTRRRKNSRTPQENEAISDKVNTLLAEGYELNQATAIAFDMFRKDKLIIPKETSREYQIQYSRKKSLVELIAEAASILKLGSKLINK